MKKLLAHLRNDPHLPRVDTSMAARVLGDMMPRLDASPVGRMRLVRALHQRFGEGWKNNDSAARVLAQFDDELDHLRKYIDLKRRSHG